MNSKQIFSKLANIQLEVSQLMADNDIEDIINRSNSNYLKAPKSEPKQEATLTSEVAVAAQDKNVDLTKVENTEGGQVLNEVVNNPGSAGQKIEDSIKENVSPEQTQKVAKFSAKVFFTDPKQQKTYEDTLKNDPEAASKMLVDATKDGKKMAADIKNKLEADKNAAFKYGLGLIVIGAMFGAIMIPSMKSQLSQILENGKPVMEKVFAALGMLATAVAAFVPMALGSLLLYFAFSENAPDKSGMMGKIINASIVFFRSIENAVFSKLPDKKVEEQKPEETPKTGEPKVNASVQQRVARLQLELAKIAHDLA